MNRHLRFVHAVQAGISKFRSITTERAIEIMARACEIPEEHVPEGTAAAASTFFSYAVTDTWCRVRHRPAWYAAWFDAENEARAKRGERPLEW